MGKRGTVVASAAAGVVLVALPAWAYYALTSVTTSPSVTAAALGTPGAGTATVSASGVSFSVSAPASGLAPTGYRVDRTAPTAVTGVCTLAAPGTCTDSSPAEGQTNSYAVYATRGGWSSLTPAVVNANVPAAVRAITVTPSTTTPTAGTAFNLTLTAKLNGATNLDYDGAKTLTWSGGQTIGAHAPAYPASPVTFTDGVATVSVTLYKAGAQTVGVTDANTTAYTGSASVTVSAVQQKLSFSACTNDARSITRNNSFTTTVTRPAADAYGNATNTAQVTVTLSPFHATQSNNNFTTQTVTIAAGATASGSATYETANNGGTATITATAVGYTNGTCSVTTT
jgi:hypothetical protein